MGVETDGYRPDTDGQVGPPGDKIAEEIRDLVEKETKVRTKLEQELGVSGAVVAICVYLTKDVATMVSADHVRRTLNRKGMSVEEVETMLREANFRRVLAWELDEECGRLADNLARAEEFDREARREVLDRQRNLPGMQEPSIQEGSSVWARPQGQEEQVCWQINNKSLTVEEITALVREHQEYEDDETPQIQWF